MATPRKDAKLQFGNFGARRILGMGFQPWARIGGEDHTPPLHFPSETEAVKAAKHLYDWYAVNKTPH